MAETNKPPHQNPPQAPNPPATKPEPAVPSVKDFGPTPKVAPKAAEGKEVKETKEEVHKKIETILAQCGGRESDIPPSHEYWQLLNQYRSMK